MSKHSESRGQFFHYDISDLTVVFGGGVNWILYRVSALFIHDVHDFRSENFENLITLLLSGTKFNRAVELSYKRTIDSLLEEFQQNLSSTSN